MSYTFPANRQKFGEWTYYSAQLKLYELIKMVEIKGSYKEMTTEPDVTAGMRIRFKLNRDVDARRVRNSIQRYLVNDNHRFFSSVVVGTMDGAINFNEFSFEESSDSSIKNFHPFFKNREIGVIILEENSTFYALDGQHRLSAIRGLIDPVKFKEEAPNFEVKTEWRNKFKEEIINVLFVPLEAEIDRWQKYRKLFATLNRYAKPINDQTIISMDEDDIFILLTRKLLEEFSFFSNIQPKHLDTIDLTGPKNMKESHGAYSNLITFRDINQEIMLAYEDHILGYFDELETLRSVKGLDEKLKIIKQIRPDDDFLEKLYILLKNIWNVILDTFEDIEKFYKKVEIIKDHDDLDKRKLHFSLRDPNGNEANILFFPAFQQHVFAKFIKKLLRDQFILDGKIPNKNDLEKILSPLKKIPQPLSSPIWNKFITQKSVKSGKLIVFNNRSAQCDLSYKLLTYMLLPNSGEWSEEELSSLKEEYKKLGDPDKTDNDVTKAFDFIDNIRNSIINE